MYIYVGFVFLEAANAPVREQRFTLIYFVSPSHRNFYFHNKAFYLISWKNFNIFLMKKFKLMLMLLYLNKLIFFHFILRKLLGKLKKNFKYSI